MCTLASPIRALGKVGGSTRAMRLPGRQDHVGCGVSNGACREAGDREVEGAGEACSHAAEITARVTGCSS